MTEEETQTEQTIESAAPVEEPPALEPEPPTGEPDEDEVDDEVVVTIGEQEPPPPPPEDRDPKLVNKLRKLLREEQRKTREYENKLRSTTQQVENTPPALGAKPKLEDFDYDAGKYEEAVGSWYERKRVADEHAAKRKQVEEAQKAEWDARVAGYAKAKASLRVRDYEDAEYTVANTLDVTQQGIIVSGSENAALVTYALGKDEARLRELASIKDPVRFAFAIAKLETQLKTTPRKTAPAPERPVKGAAPAGDHASRTLEQLREGVANGSVPMSKLLEYKKAHNIRV